ncbi:MAG: hypothetical protein B7Z43_10645, partial [Sphingomonas sp. 12-62-6]
MLGIVTVDRQDAGAVARYGILGSAGCDRAVAMTGGGMIVRVLRLAGKLLFFAVIGLCLALNIVPHFLDAIYYRGPVRDGITVDTKGYASLTFVITTGAIASAGDFGVAVQ